MSSKPEKTTSIELGTKWQFNDGKVLASASVFHIEKSDVMEGSGYESTGSFNTGKNQVQGIELGLTGNITDKLSGQIGLAIMNAKVLDSETKNNIVKTLSNLQITPQVLNLNIDLPINLNWGVRLNMKAKNMRVNQIQQQDIVLQRVSTANQFLNIGYLMPLQTIVSTKT